MKLLPSAALLLVGRLAVAAGHNHHHHNLRQHDPDEERHLVSDKASANVCKNKVEPFELGGITYNCEEEFKQSGHRCGSPGQSKEAREKVKRDIAKYKKERSTRALEQFSAMVPVYVHVMHDGTKGRKYTWESNPQYIIDQIDVLNKGFQSLPTYWSKQDSDHATGGVDTGFRFCLMGTTSNDNRSWYKDRGTAEVNYKTALKVGGPDTLNIYVNQAAGYLGYAYFPSASMVNDVRDGVVILNDSMPGGDSSRYGEGDTAVHEVGHYLGLEHTFFLGCGSSADGDYSGTKESAAQYDCPIGADTCSDDNGQPDPIHNFMDYTQDSCMDEFTVGQAQEMQDVWNVYRYNAASPTYYLANDGYSCTTSSPGPPVTAAPVNPAPVTPAPMTPAPVDPTVTPVTPAPVTPAPIPATGSPVTPAPVDPTAAPVTLAPVTPASAPCVGWNADCSASCCTPPYTCQRVGSNQRCRD